MNSLIDMKGDNIVYSLSHVTNTILVKANESGISITPMKLQKLLYFYYKSYLKTTKDPLFAERFEPWMYGPVVSDVYNTFKIYKSQPINSYYPDADGSTLYLLPNDADEPLTRCLDEVWKNYAMFSGIDLSIVTHRPDSAWTKAVKANAFTLSDTDIMDEPDYVVGDRP